MKIVVRRPSKEDKNGHWRVRFWLEIFVDGKRVFRAIDGESEDNNLYRNFKDCYTVPELMRLAHKVGLSGEELEILDVEETK